MIYSLAPMEGITGHAFRRVHAECFGALDRYYTPFLPPPRVGSPFGGKNLREIDPVNNEGLNVIPQLLTKTADEFVWGRIDTSCLISGRYPLNDIVEAYRAFEAHEDGCLKLVITPWEDR